MKIIDFPQSKNDIKLSKKEKYKIIENFAKDYSKVVVRKPWGYEYLTYQSKDVAVWILLLKKGHQTSMHSHPKKKTSLIVLDGSVTCKSLDKSVKRKSGEGIMIPKKVFHQTINNSNNDTILMEIETPNNKNDLLRLKDIYGRQNMGYEKIDKHSINVNNYNYITLESQNVYFNKTKRYGKSSITFVKIENNSKLNKILKKNTTSLFTVLKGSIIINNLKYTIGDTFSVENKEVDRNNSIESSNALILITKINDQKIRVSDLILNILDNKNINTLYCVPGDANLHLMDSLGRKETFKYFVFNDESTAATAASGATKMNNNISVLNISSGYSSSRVIEAISSAYIDSEPVLVISGQASSGQNIKKNLRQFGNKSLNTIDLVKNITKYSYKIEKEYEIAFHLEKALFLSKNGRPGPVWIDVPINVLGKTINENKLRHFSPQDFSFEKKFTKLHKKVLKIYQLINKSSRPVILIGYGIKLSNSQKNILKLISHLNIPVLTSRRGSDLIEFNHSLYFGRPGVYGNRYSNFIIQNSDLLISFGSRLSVPLTGRDTKSFCEKAKKIIIDIDENELNKNNFKADLLINDSVDDVINYMLLNNTKLKNFKTWINKCKHLKKNFNIDKEGYKHNQHINPYLFVNDLSKVLPTDSVVIMDGGVIMNYIMQTFNIKKGQRLISASGLDNEGFSFPASIGVSLSINTDKREVVCICEERTFLNSVFELNTLKKYNINIKIICFSGIAFSALKGTQKDFFGSRYVGTEFKSKKNKYDIEKIVKAFNIKYIEIKKVNEIKKKIKEVILNKEAIFCRIYVDPMQQIIPKMGFSLNDSGKWIAKPLQDMYPFLPKKIIDKIMK